MANDAKLGLLLGLVMVLTIGLVLFPRERPATPAEANPPAALQPIPLAPAIHP